MSETYPLPSHACHIWLDSDGNICLGIPPLREGDHGHTLIFPQEKLKLKVRSKGDSVHASQLGWLSIFKTLNERSQAVEPIGRPSAPVQYDIEQIMKNLKAKKASTPKVETLTMEDLFDD